MKIQSLNIGIPSQKNVKKQNSGISFGSNIYRIKRPNLQDKHLEQVYSRISNLLNKLPEGTKMKQPLLFKVDEVAYGVIWDKSSVNRNQLLLKDKIETISDWDKRIPGQSTISSIFNKNGVIEEGNLIHQKKNNYFETGHYYKNEKNKKFLIIDDRTYRPSPHNDLTWSSLPSLSCYDAERDIIPLEYFKEVKLAPLFFELIKKNVTIK